MMTQGGLPFQYKAEKRGRGLTGFAGLPLYVELAIKSGFTAGTQSLLQTKERGWSDTEMVMSLLLLNLAGGDCVSDINRLEEDGGLREVLLGLSTFGLKRRARRAYDKRWRRTKDRGFPSTAAIHRYLSQFHSGEEEAKREDGKAFIPRLNEALSSLVSLNESFISAIQAQQPYSEATLDQDATLVYTEKGSAYYSYKKQKAYQPFNTYWAEHGMLLHSEFRDGNVPASYEQLRLLETSLALLPTTVKKVLLRSDSAGYQSELLSYCAEGKAPRFGVIEFAIAARISAAFKASVAEVKAEHWQPLYRNEPDGSRIKSSQEWAEVCFVPNWAGLSKQQAQYRYIAIREAMRPINAEQELTELPFQTIETEGSRYKLFGLVTNRTLPGNELIAWHRERCGKSEQVHSVQKNGLAGGQLPSNKFGANAAWWQLMILAFNLNRLMQVAALPEALKEKQMKGLRIHLIQRPGRLIYHARQWTLRVEKEAYELFAQIRKRIAQLALPQRSVLDTT